MKAPGSVGPGVSESVTRRPFVRCGLRGFCFFLWVPIVAWLDAAIAGNGQSLLEGVVRAHQQRVGIWVIDMVPVLGAFVAICASRKSHQLEDQVREVESLRAGQEAAHQALHDQNDIRQKEFDRLAELHRAAARRFEELFQGLPVACFTYDRSGILYESNREMERLWGIPGARMQQRPVCESVWAQGDLQQWKSLNERVFAGETINQIELWFPDGCGAGKWVLFSSIPLRSMEGEVMAAIASLLDITDRKEMEQRISENVVELNQVAKQLAEQKAELEIANGRLALQATTDGLTGVANRRLFREALDKACAHWSSGRSISLIMLDVDHFKTYNDTFGHQAGDDLLKLIADELKGAVRPDDVAARFGGEEFVLLLPGSDASQASAAAERIRLRLCNLNQACQPVSASFGVATMSAEGLDPRTFLEQADAALYVSKRSGRNQVTHWNEISADVHRAA